MRNERTKGVWLTLIVVLLHTGSVFAQSDDWGLWTSLSIEKKLTRQWEAKLEGEYRLKNDFSQTDKIRSGVDVTYKPFKFLKFSTGYELIADKKPNKDIFVYRNRFKVDATGSWGIDRFTLSWRPRLQLTHYNDVELSKNDPDDLKWSLRNRFGVQYNIPKVPLKAYAQFETFHRIFTDLEPAYFGRRISVGLDYSITKQHEVGLGYKQDTELLTNVHNHLNVIAAGYKFLF